jgi:hypothetical protein
MSPLLVLADANILVKDALMGVTLMGSTLMGSDTNYSLLPSP